jgi:hypothetical protein
VVRFGIFTHQQFTGMHQAIFARGVFEQSIVTDSMQPGRQDMEQEAADELIRGERHGLVSRASPDPIVLPAEGNPALVERDKAAVWRSPPDGCEVGQHGLGSGEWALGVDDPRIPIEGKFGQGENGYRLNYIRAKRADTSLELFNSIFLVMNLQILLGLFIAWIKKCVAVTMRCYCELCNCDYVIGQGILPGNSI